MALPVINTPTYELKVPSTKQVVKFRPFLVKEEKALLIAQQSEEASTMFDTLKSIVKACTFSKLDVEKLATFDIEYIFLQLRAKSVGEISELTFSCLECGDPKAKINVSVDLTKVEVQFNDEHSADIKLTEDIGLKMKYPSLDIINKLKLVNETDVNEVFNLIVNCVEMIYDSDNVYVAAEQSREDIVEFINNLTQEQFIKVQKFFETMPKLEKKIEFNCPICSFKHTEVLQGINDFF